MPITADHVGRSYPPGEPHEVTPERVAAFAEAIGETVPAVDGAADVPPTFVMGAAASAWQALFDDPELELSLARTVHADQRFHWSRQIRPGEVIVPQLSISSVRTRGITDTIGIRVVITVASPDQASNQDAEQVCVAESTLVHSRSEAA